LRYLQSVGDHSVEQLWDVVVFEKERRAKPLRIILGVLTNPFTRPLSERPNECKRALWQDPDVGFASGAVHCLPSVFANGGSGLIGKSGRKTANVCDKHAKETTRNIATHFTAVAFIILLRKTRRKVPEDVPNEGQGTLSALIDHAQPRPHSAHFHGN
jgi:hypothetical protein